jgi:hypothetical protein
VSDELPAKLGIPKMVMKPSVALGWVLLGINNGKPDVAAEMLADLIKQCESWEKSGQKDYRSLLKTYMATVLLQEGVSFIQNVPVDMNSDEMEELRVIEKEIIDAS